MSGQIAVAVWNSWRGQTRAQILDIEDPSLVVNLVLAIDDLSHENIRCGDRRNQSSFSRCQDSRPLDAARSFCVWLKSALGMSVPAIARCCDYTIDFIRGYKLKYVP